MLVVFFVVIVCAFFLFKYHLHNRRLLKHVRHIPTDGLPFIGVGHRFIGKSTTGMWLISEITCEIGRLKKEKITWSVFFLKKHTEYNKNYFSNFFHQGIYNEIVKISVTHQNPSRYWVGPILFIVISSPEDMQTVLNSPHCLQKSHVYDFFDTFEDNDGLFTAKGK